MKAEGANGAGRRRCRDRDDDQDRGGGERLQKVLAARGVASRRAAEELIQDGRVKVDGRVVTELGTKVDPQRARIAVDGRPLRQPRPTYLLLNKPRGYLTTASDPEGRRTVFDLIDERERVFPVGRLDMDSEGLLLLTNDGELANRIAHPRYRIDKEYHALVEGAPSPQALDWLRRGGFPVEGRRTGPAEVAVIEREAGGTWLRVIIHEGRKHQVRRMLEAVGHPVRRLRRVRLGPLTLAGMPPAAYRPLTGQELARLRRMLGLEADESDAPALASSAAKETKGREAGAGPRASRQELGAGRPRSTRARPPAAPPGGPRERTRGQPGAREQGVGRGRGGGDGRSRGGGGERGGRRGGADGGGRTRPGRARP